MKSKFVTFAVLVTLSLVPFGLAAMYMLDVRGCVRIGGEYLLIPLPWVIYFINYLPRKEQTK